MAKQGAARSHFWSILVAAVVAALYLVSVSQPAQTAFSPRLTYRTKAGVTLECAVRYGASRLPELLELSAALQAPVATPSPQWSLQQRPLRPDEGDLYVMPDGAISYLDNMLAFFQRKGLRVMYYNPGYSYRPSDIILLPYAPHPLPSTCTLVLDNNKRRTWDFLKLVFAARGITL